MKHPAFSGTIYKNNNRIIYHPTRIEYLSYEDYYDEGIGGVNDRAIKQKIKKWRKLKNKQA